MNKCRVLVFSSSTDTLLNQQTDRFNPAVTIWNPNIYLYEAARYGNIPLMQHALALGAEKNFINDNDNGRTPLIQAIVSVR